MSKILVIAAHPDDEVLGVGATIVNHVKNGDECYALILGEGITSRYRERELADGDRLEMLHKNTFESSKIIGYKNVYLENFPDNRFDSVEILDIIKVLESYIEKIKPDIIYTHHGGDLNIDHKITYQAVLTATRPIGNEYIKEIYSFETVSSTEWNFDYINNFKPNYFIDVTDTIEIKLKAVNCYKTEMRQFPHPRSIKNLEVVSKKWGSVISREYAEAFQIIRIIK